MNTSFDFNSHRYFTTLLRTVLEIVILAAFLSSEVLQCSIGHAAEIKTVRLAHWGQSKVFIYLPLYVATDLGYFRDEGIDIQIVYSGNDDQVFAAVVGGGAIAGLADPAFAAVSRERGGTGRSIAILVNRVANWGIGKDSSMANFKFPQDLNGRKISSFPSPSTAYSILKDIQTKFSLTQMKIVELAPGTEVAALQRGDIDIALTGEPAVSVAEENGFPVVLSLGSYYGPFAFSGITTTDENIKAFPHELQAIVSGLQRALEFMRSNPSATIDIAARNFSNIPRPVIQRAVKRLIDEDCFPKNVLISTDAWDRTMKLRKEIGDLKTDQHSDALDNQFAIAALKVEIPARSQLGVASNAGSPKSPEESLVSLFDLWLSRAGSIASIISLITIYVFVRNYLKSRSVQRRAAAFRSEYYRKVAHELFDQLGKQTDRKSRGRLAAHLVNQNISSSAAEAHTALDELLQAGFLATVRGKYETGSAEEEIRLVQGLDNHWLVEILM
ncbi:MAG: ABC transporter substrate-binding protein [Beijerinckiaceae bacterium]